MADEPKCPNCNSRSVKKSSAAFDQGRSRYQGRSGGFGISSSGRIGAYRGSHAGERISVVASKNAPPGIDAGRIASLTVAAVPTLMLFGALINGFMGLIIGGLLAIVIAPVIALLGVLFPVSDVQKQADEQYAKQWYCNRCGESFFWEKSS